jgi:ribose transport system substrate-binding protein
MKLMGKTALAVLALAVIFTSGCEERHSTKEVFYLIGTNMKLPYWQTAAEGFQRAAAEYKVTSKVVGPDGHDPQAELAALHSAIAAKPSGILISVADATLLQSEINAAVYAGIPVITFDSDAANSRRMYFIGTNNLEAGRLGGQRIIEKLGGKGNVVFFTLSGQPNTAERLKGFKEVLDTRPDIHITAVVDIKGDARNAFDWTQESLALEGPQRIDAFISLESASGKLVADAVKRGGGGREILAFDVDQDTLDAIKSGAIDATIAQKPFTMAYVGLKELDAVYHDPPKDLTRDYSPDSFAPYPVFIDTGTSLVDQNNVDLYIAGAAEGNR